MPSKPKTVSERLLGKTVKLVDGTDAIVIGISADNKTARLEQGKKRIALAVEEIETRGSKFFEKTKIQNEEGSKMSEATPAPVENVEVKPALPTAEVVEESMEAEPVVENIITCQFCCHAYNPENGGLVKPEDTANMCQDCLVMAEDGLLKRGIPGGDISEEMVVEWLCRHYGMVNSDLVIQIIGNTSQEESCGDNCTCDSAYAESPVEEEFVHDFQTSVEEFIFARKEIAKTLVRVINLVSGNASIGEETPEFILLKLEPFDFELTSLCGGWIVSQTEAGMVREQEFTALDELFAYFCGAQEDGSEDTELPDEEEDFEDDEVLSHLPLGTFYRLQNCKSEENNKKLVQIIEFFEPETEDGSYTYRVVDKEGKKYKVAESKLKPSVKSF